MIAQNEMVEAKPLKEKEVEYTPLGEANPIKLSMEMVKRWLMSPTKNGHYPTDQDVMKFIMLCKARELNPWVGDAFCVGYDSKEGPVFNLITSVQALFKRAESHPQFDGLQSGVIVKTKDGRIEEREGDWFDDDEKLVGGWAKVYRKDRKLPFVEKIKLATFNKNRSVWLTDPAGMISKNGEAGALRKAFPTQLGGLYLREEMDHRTVEGSATPVVQGQMDEVTRQLAEKRQAIAHTPSAPDFTEQAEAAKQQREQAETVQAKRPAAETVKQSKAEPAEQTEQAAKESTDIVEDYKAQIAACESEEEAKVLCMTIHRSTRLTEDQKKHLRRIGNEKVHSFGRDSFGGDSLSGV